MGNEPDSFENMFLDWAANQVLEIWSPFDAEEAAKALSQLLIEERTNSISVEIKG